jgi:hypothetical protein
MMSLAAPLGVEVTSLEAEDAVEAVHRESGHRDDQHRRE